MAALLRGDSGSESDATEYEQDGSRANTAFDVRNVPEFILDRGIWNPNHGSKSPPGECDAFDMGAEVHKHANSKFGELQGHPSDSSPQAWELTPDRSPENLARIQDAHLGGRERVRARKDLKSARFKDEIVDPTSKDQMNSTFQQQGPEEERLFLPRIEKKREDVACPIGGSFLRISLERQRPQKLQQQEAPLERNPQKPQKPQHEETENSSKAADGIASEKWMDFQTPRNLAPEVQQTKVPKRSILKGLSKQQHAQQKVSGSLVLIPPGNVRRPFHENDTLKGEGEGRSYLFKPLPVRGQKKPLAGGVMQTHTQDDNPRVKHARSPSPIPGEESKSGKKNELANSDDGFESRKRGKEMANKVSEDVVESTENGMGSTTSAEDRDVVKIMEQKSDSPFPEHAVWERTTSVREVLKAARKEVLKNDEIMDMPKRSASMREESPTPIIRVSYRSKSNLGTYTNLRGTAKTGMQIDRKTDRSIEPETFIQENYTKGHGTRPDSLQDQVSIISNRPFFFKAHELKDPVQSFRERERTFKRDGSLRDRLRLAEFEASIRSKVRASEVSSMKGPLKPLAGRDLLRATVDNVPREVQRALTILEGRLPRSSLNLEHVRAITPDVDVELSLDRLVKGLSSVDTKLLAGRDACILPKVETKIDADVTNKMDTRQLPTKEMIQVHAKMLDKQARQSTKAAFRSFQENEAQKLDDLRKNSWDVVQRWDELLDKFPMIREGIKELSCVEFGWKENLVNDGAVINAYLRTGADERAERVLAVPQIRDMIKHHPQAYQSELRRKKIVKLLEDLNQQRLALMHCSDKVMEKRESIDTSLTPLRLQLMELSNVVHNCGESGGTKEQLDQMHQLNENVAKLELSFEKSIEVEELDASSGAIIHTIVTMDAILNEEEECIQQVKLEENYIQTVVAKRKAKEEIQDMKKKISYLFDSNPGENGRVVCETLINIVARICVDPLNREWRAISSSSRSSPIQLILAAKGGREVLLALGFYQGNSVWSVPSDHPTDKMQVGCEFLCVLLGIPDQILLRKMNMQRGSVATDLLKKMMTEKDSRNDGSKPQETSQDMEVQSQNMENKMKETKIAHTDSEEHRHVHDIEIDDDKDEHSQRAGGQDYHQDLNHQDVKRDQHRIDEDREETVEEKALTQLFFKLDKDAGGSLSSDEIRIALAEFNIDEERQSAVLLLEEVESHGEEGMQLEAFKASMLKILAEPVAEADPFEGMEEEQVARLKNMLKRLVNSTLFEAWDNWKMYSNNQQLLRTGALENYKHVSQVLTIPPVISTLFRRFLQSRTEDVLHLGGRGMSSLAFKAFACGMTGYQPDFIKIECMQLVPKEYILTHPEDTFAVRCDPCVNVFELRKNGACVPMTGLDLRDNAGGQDGARDIKTILMNTFGCLKYFNLSNNNIGEEGAKHIAQALSDSNGPRLVKLELASNKMGDKGTANVIRALADSPLIRTLMYFDISGNECGQESAVEMGKYLQDEVCVLEHLDISWNMIRNEVSAEVFNGLASNINLTYLKFGWNGVDLKGCGAICEALKACALVELDLNHCNISGAGAIVLAEGLKKNTMLRKLILDGNNLMQSGARALIKSSIASGAHTDKSGVDRIISMIECNLQSVDSTTFNKAEPAGRYRLDLADPYDKSTFRELLGIAFEGKGSFASLPAPCVDVYYDDTWKDLKIVVPDQPNDEKWEMPPTGLISFCFESMMSTENASEVTLKELDWLYNELNLPGKTERHRIGAIRAFCDGESFLRYDQAADILNMLPEDTRSAERCELVQQSFSRLTESERAVELLHLLTINERKEVERKLGVAAITFTKNNATGKYRLDLAKKSERNICLRLCEINNSQLVLLRKMDTYYASRKGGARPPVERTWRNAKFDDQPQSYSPTWAVPQKGFLEVDFVQISKPMTADNLTSDEDFLMLLKKMRSCGDDEKIAIIKNWLDRKVVTCEQVEELITCVKGQKNRVEVLSLTFARVLDWHGYTSLISMISIAELNMLVKKIGFVNLFDEVMAVGYHEFDLAIPEQRWAAQELVHLAMIEPGENMVDTQYNGVDFPLPVGWGVEVPKKGQFSFYYCREQEVIEKVLKYGSYDGSDYPYNVDGEIPVLHRSHYGIWYLKDFLQHEMPQPAGSDWVRHVRMRRIKSKMLQSAQDATQMFQLLDSDGGGSLDRKEMAVGLFRLGVWLQPIELAALMEALDEDGGGEIDLAEFSTWWSETPLLPPTRLHSAATRWMQRAKLNPSTKKLLHHVE